MSGPDREPVDRDREVPWWESGEAPERFSLPRTGRRRAVAIVAVVVVLALFGLLVWGVMTGAASMGSMPM